MQQQLEDHIDCIDEAVEDAKQQIAELGCKFFIDLGIDSAQWTAIMSYAKFDVKSVVYYAGP